MMIIRYDFIVAGQKRCRILEEHMVQDHMLIAILPRYDVSELLGYLKDKSARAVARKFSGRKRNYNGDSLWARDYASSTVRFEEEQN
ncbi:transposase [Spartinivicinus ruber]|uniref:transposase n=1 Tax=Spartinivicinus ruber TaxID=2683272 RepID=UPI0013D145E9|nr:transposase [Spartinivicinus ruber]